MKGRLREPKFPETYSEEGLTHLLCPLRAFLCRHCFMTGQVSRSKLGTILSCRQFFASGKVPWLHCALHIQFRWERFLGECHTWDGAAFIQATNNSSIGGLIR